MEKNTTSISLLINARETKLKCGLMPSELLEQRNELIDALNILNNAMKNIEELGVITLSNYITIAEQAIIKATE